VSISAAEQHVRTARAQIVFKRPYLSHGFHALVLVETTGCKTMATDRWRRLYFNPEWVLNYTVEQIASVIYHELKHPLRRHHERADMLGITQATWQIANICMDSENNDDHVDEVDEFGDLAPLPEPVEPELLALPEEQRGPFYPWKLGCEDGQLWETYYQHMMKDVEIVLVGVGFAHQDCGSGCHGQGRPWELPGLDGSDNAPEGVSDADWADVEQRVAADIQEYAKSGRGKLPGGWKDWSDTILRPHYIPWEQVLAGVMRWAITTKAGMILHSYLRPSRRQSALPDFVMPCMRRPEPTVVIVGDASGSMMETLPLVRGVVEDLCTSMGARIAFLSTDTEVHGGVQNVTGGRGLELRGLGGTDMRVGIDYALQNVRPKPDVIVVVTDCDTPWPAHPTPCRLVVCATGASEYDIARVPSWAKLVIVEHRGKEETQ
jgi:predicted metal-dependent peptidase